MKWDNLMCGDMELCELNCDIMRLPIPKLHYLGRVGVMFTITLSVLRKPNTSAVGRLSSH